VLPETNGGKYNVSFNEMVFLLIFFNLFFTWIYCIWGSSSENKEEDEKNDDNDEEEEDLDSCIF
jgi:hypothetical protein